MYDYDLTLRPVTITKATITVYRVRIGNRYTHYHTFMPALRKACWWMIFDKYWPWADGRNGMEDKPAHLPECRCDYDMTFADLWDTNDCPLHDRRTGYFRRLHTRLMRRYRSDLIIDRTH